MSSRLNRQFNFSRLVGESPALRSAVEKAKRVALAKTTVLLLGEDVYVEDPLYCNCPMPEDLRNKRVEQNVGDYNSYDCMVDGVTASGQLIAPTDYVTVLH